MFRGYERSLGDVMNVRLIKKTSHGLNNMSKCSVFRNARPTHVNKAAMTVDDAPDRPNNE